MLPRRRLLAEVVGLDVHQVGRQLVADGLVVLGRRADEHDAEAQLGQAGDDLVHPARHAPADVGVGALQQKADVRPLPVGQARQLAIAHVQRSTMVASPGRRRAVGGDGGDLPADLVGLALQVRHLGQVRPHHLAGQAPAEGVVQHRPGLHGAAPQQQRPPGQERHARVLAGSAHHLGGVAQHLLQRERQQLALDQALVDQLPVQLGQLGVGGQAQRRQTLLVGPPQQRLDLALDLPLLALQHRVGQQAHVVHRVPQRQPQQRHRQPARQLPAGQHHPQPGLRVAAVPEDPLQRARTEARALVGVQRAPGSTGESVSMMPPRFRRKLLRARSASISPSPTRPSAGRNRAKPSTRMASASRTRGPRETHSSSAPLPTVAPTSTNMAATLMLRPGPTDRAMPMVWPIADSATSTPATAPGRRAAMGTTSDSEDSRTGAGMFD